MDASTKNAEPALSGHEQRCLCRRIDECEEALQIAILGAGQACAKTRHAPGLVQQIREALEAAERQLERAHRLARRMAPR